jgi:hypothetical protein
MPKSVDMKRLILRGLNRRINNNPTQKTTIHTKEGISMTTKDRLITVLSSIALVACFALAGPSAHAQKEGEYTRCDQQHGASGRYLVCGRVESVCVS